MDSCKIHYDGAKITLVEINAVDRTRDICTGAEDIFFYFKAGGEPVLETDFIVKRGLFQRIQQRLHRWRR